jgi:hypothetical protein
MNHNVEHLIDQAILALEDSNLDASWHFMRRAKNVVHSIAATEREACAKVCENIGDYDENVDEYYSDIYASAIRARGQA